MNKSVKILLTTFLVVIVLSLIEIIYYGFDFDKNILMLEKKSKAVSLIKLPDLALASETIWIRHRSISNIFSIFPEDGTLLEYYPSSFVYNIHIQSNLKDVGKIK